jgi:hypothetical protein
MLDRGVKFHHVSAGNYFIKDRYWRFLPSFPHTFRLTTAHGCFHSSFAQAFNQSFHASQTQSFDQLVSWRFMGVG